MVDCASLCLADGAACNVFHWQEEAGRCSHGKVRTRLAARISLCCPVQIPCLLQYDGADGVQVWVNADSPVKRYNNTG